MVRQKPSGTELRNEYRGEEVESVQRLIFQKMLNNGRKTKDELEE